MTPSKEQLDHIFHNFSTFIQHIDHKPFSSFKNSTFIESEENYKYSVYKEAKERLGSKLWKMSDIGTGKIKNNGFFEYFCGKLNICRKTVFTKIFYPCQI